MLCYNLQNGFGARKMETIYVDSLFILNFVLNYFLVSVTAFFGAKKTRSGRMVIAGLFGAVCSLYIFIPFSFPEIDVVYRMTVSFLMVLIAFKFGNLRRFLRIYGIFIAATLVFGGLFLALVNALPDGISVRNNGIFYIDFSPLVFLLVATIFYCIIRLYKRFVYRRESRGFCKVTVFTDTSRQMFNVLFDNGHTLRDIFTDLPVLVLSVDECDTLINEFERSLIRERDFGRLLKFGYRVIPCKTVSDNGLIPVTTPQKVMISEPDGTETEIKVSVGFTYQHLSDNFSGVINAGVLDEV